MIEITPSLAAKHEALVLRLEPLLRQVEVFGRRRPEAAAPAELVGLAAELLRAEHCLLGRDRAALEHPVPKSFAGLAAALGQARARLMQFEAQHSVWNTGLNAHVWRGNRDAKLPVRRLRPQLSDMKTPAEQRQADHMREELMRRLDAKISTAYDQGFSDAQAGKPHHDPVPRFRR